MVQFAPAAAAQLNKLSPAALKTHFSTFWLQRCCSALDTTWHKTVLGFSTLQMTLVKKNCLAWAQKKRHLLIWFGSWCFVLMERQLEWKQKKKQRTQPQEFQFRFEWLHACVHLCERMKNKLSNADNYELMKRESYCLMWKTPPVNRAILSQQGNTVW